MMYLKYKRRLRVEIKTSDPGLLRDELFGLVWHKLNEGIHQQKDCSVLLPLYDFVKSVHCNDEIVSRFEEHYNLLGESSRSKIAGILKTALNRTKALFDIYHVKRNSVKHRAI